MNDCNPVTTPLDPNQKLTSDMSPKNEEDRIKMQDVQYREAVGSLLYASQETRPDIAHAVGIVSKYLSNPSQAHWKAVKRIMRYLKGTINAKLAYSKN